MDAATVTAVFRENKQKISDDLASRCMSFGISSRHHTVVVRLRE
jgi:hypothetical protein